MIVTSFVDIFCGHLVHFLRIPAEFVLSTEVVSSKCHQEEKEPETCRHQQWPSPGQKQWQWNILNTPWILQHTQISNMISKFLQQCWDMMFWLRTISSNRNLVWKMSISENFGYSELVNNWLYGCHIITLLAINVQSSVNQVNFVWLNQQFKPNLPIMTHDIIYN